MKGYGRPTFENSLWASGFEVGRAKISKTKQGRRVNA